MDEKVRSIRIPLLYTAPEILVSYDNKIQTARITNISEGGAAIGEVIDLPKPHSEIKFQITLPGTLGKLAFTGVVKWVRWVEKTIKENNRERIMPKGFGIQLINFDDTKKIWNAYVIFLRNKEIIDISKKILADWFNGNDLQ